MILCYMPQDCAAVRCPDFILLHYIYLYLTGLQGNIAEHRIRQHACLKRGKKNNNKIYIFIFLNKLNRREKKKCPLTAFHKTEDFFF